MAKPVVHGRDHEHGGADPIRILWETTGEPGSGGGLQFELDPQAGGWLVIETTSTEIGGPTDDAIRLTANVGGISLNAVAHNVEIIAGNDVKVVSGRDLILSTDRDLQVNVDRDAALVAEGDILLNARTGNLFLAVPSIDPGISGAVWNDGGTLKVSA